MEGTFFFAVEGQTNYWKIGGFVADGHLGLDQYPATIDWGDGTTSPGEIVPAEPRGPWIYYTGWHLWVYGSHVYADETSSTYTLTLTVGDGSGTASVRVTDAALTPSNVTLPLVEGDAVASGTVLGGFTDDNPLATTADFTATVDWGDGSPTEAGTVSGGPGGFVVTGSAHRYKEEGSYPISIHVADDGGSATNVYSTAKVKDAPLSGSGTTLFGWEEQPLTDVLVANFADSDPTDTPDDPNTDTGDYSATISWGDGNTSAGTIGYDTISGTFTVSGSHTYTDGGKYATKVVIQDVGGAQVVVSGVAIIRRLPWYLGGYQRRDEVDQANLVPLGESVVALNTGGVRLSHPLDFDLSPGTGVGGSPLLQYNSDTVSVRPIIETILTSAGDQPVPLSIDVELSWNNGSYGPAVTFATTGHNPGDLYLLDAEVGSPVTQSGVYPWTVQATIHLPDDVTLVRTASGYAHVVARDASPFGAGWGLTGTDQLVSATDGLLWVYPSGDTRFFTALGNGAFASPPEDFGTLASSGSGYAYTAKDHTVWNFDSGGRLSSVVDPHGLALTYTYTSGELTGVQAPDGSLTTLTYSTGQVAIAEPGGRTVTLTLDGAGNLSGISDADGSGRSFGYDGGHRLTGDSWAPFSSGFSYSTTNDRLTGVTLGALANYAVSPASVEGLKTNPAVSPPDYKLAHATLTDALGHTTTSVLDVLARLRERDTADGAVETWGLNFNGLPDVHTDQDGQVTGFGYNDKGDLTEADYADGSWQKFQYEPTFEHLTQESNSLGEAVNYTNDPATGDRLTATDAVGRTTTYTYYQSGGKSNGLLQAMTDPRGNVTTFQYDTNRRQTLLIDALGNRTTTAYDPAGNPRTVTDPLGHVVTTVYDPRNRLVERDDPAGTTTFSYDSFGDQTGTTDPLGNRTQLTYNAFGLPWAVTNAAGTGLAQTTTTTYDGAGNARAVTDANGHTTTFLYDSVNRRTAAIDPLNDRTTFAYDPAGYLLAVTDPLGHTTTTGYDKVGRPVTVTDALNHTTTTTYDAAGPDVANVLAVTDANGNTTRYGYDADNRRVSVTNPLVQTTTTEYDPAGNVQDTVDPLGNRTTFTYDPLNRVTAVKDALNEVTTTAYDAAGNVVAVTDPLNHTTTFGYDAANRRTSVTDALNHTTTTVYDAGGNIRATVDPLGRRTTFAYDALNRVTAVTDALNGVTTTVYDTAGNVLSVIDPLGRVTSYGYDPAERRTATIEAFGTAVQRTTTVGYDPAGNVTVSIDPLGYRTTLTYDAANRRLTSTDPLGLVTTTSYDPAGNVLATTNPRGLATTYSYDLAERLTRTTDAAGSPATTVYDPAGNVIATADARGDWTFTSYDALNRPVTRTDALGRITTTVYDSAGNVVNTIDAGGNTTTMAYDAANRRASVQDPDGGIATTVYDAAGNVVNTIDPVGSTSTFAYDALNRRTTSTDALTGTTTTAYDAVGNAVSVIDPDGNRTAFAFDALNRSTQQTDPLNHSATFAYDLAGHLMSTTDRLGRVRNLAYDADGRLTTETWLAQGTAVNTLTYSYDGDGNQLTAGDARGGYTMTYDALDRLATVRGPLGTTLTYGYDAASNRTLVQDSFGGVLTSVYNQVNELKSRQFGGSGQTPLRIDLTYTALDQVVGVSRYADLAGTQLAGASDEFYDAAGRLTMLQHLDAGSNLVANYSYTYDPAGRVLTETLNDNTVTYSYDATGQLIGDGTGAYSYDAAGNRTMAGYQTGAGNQLTNDGTWTYTYDAEGNLVKKSKGASAETWTYGYDQRNQLVWAEDRQTDGGTLLERLDFAYDVFGNRVEKDVEPGVGPVQMTRFAYDGSNVWADLDSSNGLLMRRVYGDGPDQPLARVTSGGTAAWYLADRQGSVRDVENGAGTAVLDHLDYDGYGNVTAETQPAAGDRYKYTAREFDGETGLQFNHARYYDPKAGRWTSQDPLGFGAGDANLYRYVKDSPTNFVDPSGLQTLRTVPSLTESTDPGYRIEITWAGTRIPPARYGGGRINVQGGPQGEVRVYTGGQCRLVADNLPDIGFDPPYMCNSIALGYYGTHADQVKVIQFVWMSIVVTKNGQNRYLELPFPIHTNAGDVEITTRNDQKKWYVDSDEGIYYPGSQIRSEPTHDDQGSFLILDAPETEKHLRPLTRLVQEIPAFGQGITRIVSVDTFDTYFVTDQKPLYKVSWRALAAWNATTGKFTDRQYEVLGGQADPTYEPGQIGALARKQFIEPAMNSIKRAIDSFNNSFRRGF